MTTAHRVLRRFRAAIEYGRGTDAAPLSWQGAFDKVTPCVKCGRPAPLALVVREQYDESKPDDEQRFVCHLYDNPQVVDGKHLNWLHDCAAFAIYLCREGDCMAATCHWNQALG